MTDSWARPLLIRLEAVDRRLSGLAGLRSPDGLTAPDASSGERWQWGQVWAHLAEFPSYWTREIRNVLATTGSGSPSFGRMKTDPSRLGAIERDRTVPAQELMDRLRPQLEELRRLLSDMTTEDWARTVAHPSLGTIGMDRVMEEFLVGHLEAHADQLDSLVERG
jgi:hypothetical protein